MSYTQGMIDGLHQALQMINQVDKDPNFKTVRACLVAAIADYEDAIQKKLDEMEREAERYGQMQIIHFAGKENGEMSDTYITNAINNKKIVRVIITNGFQFSGVIVRETLEAIEIDCGKDGRKYVYKHAISTIA